MNRPAQNDENHPLHEAACKREQVLHAVQLAEGAGHEELKVVEVLAAPSVGKGNHVKHE